MSQQELQMDPKRWVELDEGVYGSRPPFNQLRPVYTECFADFAERSRAIGLLETTKVKVAQELRRHPNLRAKVETAASWLLRREIDLTRRLT